MNNVNKWVSIYLFTFLLNMNSWAGPSKIDFRKELGPTRDQNQTGLCVSHAVADAMTKKYGVQVGALSVAFRYYEKREGAFHFLMAPFTTGGPQTYQAGLASKALRIAANSTLCLKKSERINTKEVEIRRFLKKHKRFRSLIQPNKPVKEINDVVLEASMLFPGLNSSHFEEQLSVFSPLPMTMGKWIDKDCTLSAMTNQNIEVIGDELDGQSKDEVISMIDEALENGSIPLIHYSANFLLGKVDYFWRKIIGTHVSSIAGRKIEKGEKFYLLRNSWGGSCQYYSPKYQLACERGHIWISESDLRKATTTATYLK
jgi:hypothetical protein